MFLSQLNKLDFKDVLIVPQKSSLKSRSEVDLNIEYTFKHSKKSWYGTPIIAANMDTVGTFEMASILSKNNIITAIHKHYSDEDWNSFFNLNPSFNTDYLAVSTGISKNDISNIRKIFDINSNLNFLCIDVANGYSEVFLNCIRKCREEFPEKTIMAGNVVTPEITEEIILNGADIVKLGIGPGSVCTTRKQTGVGYPQLSCILESKEAAHQLGGYIISDGGCTVPGDLSKAFGAGADFVMLGGMLAGHEECSGETITIENKKYKDFYGMSSSTAMIKHSGKVAEYRSSEGKHVRVPYKGYVQDTVNDMLGGLRSTCTYINAKNISELKTKVSFIRVTQQTNDVFSSN